MKIMKINKILKEAYKKVLTEEVVNKDEIEEKLKEYKIENYTINDDGSIDVDGDVYLSNKNLTEIPFNFNKVTGDFDCSDNELTSLKGSPKEVGGNYITYTDIREVFARVKLMIDIFIGKRPKYLGEEIKIGTNSQRISY